MMIHIVYNLGVLSLACSPALLAGKSQQEILQQLKDDEKCQSAIKAAFNKPREHFKVDWNYFDFSDQKDIQRTQRVKEALASYLDGLIEEIQPVLKAMGITEGKGTNHQVYSEYNYFLECKKELLESFEEAIQTASQK